MAKIIGLAGKKQSGKGSCASFLIRNSSKLWPDLDDDGWLVGDRAATFPFAGPIKQFCLDVLGLAPEQVYGTNEQKSTLTRYRWEDLPYYCQLVADIRNAAEREHLWDWELADKGSRYLMELKLQEEVEKRRPKGLMTARQVMQQVGSSMRKWNPNVWIEANLREIERSVASVAIIDDVRHINEVQAILAAGGVVYRTTRVVDPTDTHESEVSLDPERFDWRHFTGIIDNATFGVRWTLLAFFGLLVRDGLVSPDVSVDSLDFGDAK